MKQWEYKYTYSSDQLMYKQLEEFGLDGWEMCGVHQIPNTIEFAFYWKRELVTKPEEKI